MCESISKAEIEESKIVESKDEFFSETLDNNVDYKKLRLENENIRQELYELHLKLDHNEAMQRELQELNESLEQLLQQEKERAHQNLQKIQEKYREIETEYEKRISYLENELKVKMEIIEELQKCMEKHKNVATQQTLDEYNTSEDTIASLNKKIKGLLLKAEVDKKKQDENQEIIHDLNNQLIELKESLQVTKNQLAEKNEALESTREELALCRSEIEILKAVPTSELSKGNSLFAEVEDRRQMMVNKVTTYRNKYHETKQAYNAALEEIQILKTEKAAALKKCEEYVVNTVADRNDLIEKYKKRICELQEKLKLQLKNNRDTSQVDKLSFGYMESLLTEKKKEIEQLQQKIENNSIEMLVQAEIKDKLMKQFRYWQYKAMSMEAQIMAIKNLSKLEFANSPQYEGLCQILNEHKSIDEEFPKLFEEKYVDVITNTSFTTKPISETSFSSYHNSEIEDSANRKVKADTAKIELQNWLDSNNILEKKEEKENKEERGPLRNVLQFAADTKDVSNSVLKKNKKPKECPIMYISSKSTK